MSPSQPRWFSALARLGRGLGDTEPKLADFDRRILPVIVVGDGHELSPPLLAPKSSFGGFIFGGGTASTFALIQYTGGPTGNIIELRVSMSAGVGLRYRTVETPIVMTGPTVQTNFALWDGGATMLARQGQGPGPMSSNVPSLLNDENHIWQQPLEPGITLELQPTTNSGVMYVAVIVTDLVPPESL